MGISERRELEKKILKKKIFDAASEIIINEGYEKLSIRKIAQKIEYSPAVIYKYFENKESLVTSIVMETILRIYSSITALELGNIPADKALEKVLTEFLWLLIENPQQYRATALLWLMSGNPHQNKPYEYEKNPVQKGISDNKAVDDPSDDEIIKILAGILERGMKEGVFRKVDAKLNAMLMMSAVYGLISRVILDNISDKDIMASLFESHADLLVNSVLCPSVSID